MLKIGKSDNGNLEVTRLLNIESDEFENKVNLLVKRELDRYGINDYEIENVRLTFINAKDKRKSAKETSKTVKNTIIGVVITALSYVIYEGLKFYSGVK